MSEHSAVLVRGLVVGLAIAAPVGPIGVLCIRRTLTDGRWWGFVSGMGAATADALYGAGGRHDLAGMLVLGVFAGSALWWLVLSTGVGLARARLGPRGLAWVNRLSGAVIFAFGVAALAGARP